MSEHARSDARSWLSLVLRLALGIPWLAAGAAIVSAGPHAARAGESWLASRGLLLPPGVHAVLVAAVAVLLLAGWHTRLVAATAAGLTLALHLEWLRIDPMYPPLRHVAPFLAASLALVWAASQGDRFGLDGLRGQDARGGPDPRRAALLALRMFLGAIFVAQGWHDAAGPGGVLGFARSVYVEPYRPMLPVPLLWAAGVANPVIQLLSGAALVAGVRTRVTALGAAAFLVSIVLGHVLADPFDLAADLHQYALQNLAVALAIAALAEPRSGSASRAAASVVA